MSQLLYGSICLTDLIAQAKVQHPSITKAKNDKLYVNVKVWINDEPDQYGNNASIQIAPPKDSDLKPIYFGNLKLHLSQANLQQQPDQSALDDLDDLPY